MPSHQDGSNAVTYCLPFFANFHRFGAAQFHTISAARRTIVRRNDRSAPRKMAAIAATVPVTSSRPPRYLRCKLTGSPKNTSKNSAIRPAGSPSNTANPRRRKVCTARAPGDHSTRRAARAGSRPIAPAIASASCGATRNASATLYPLAGCTIPPATPNGTTPC